MNLYNIKNTAKLAAEHYINFNDKNLHDIPYFYAFFGADGASAHHSEWDFGDATGRYLDALILCRKVIGENGKNGKNSTHEMHEIEEMAHKYYEALKWMISLGDDGICHRPGGYDFVNGGINTFDIRSALLGLITYYKSYENYESVKNEVLEVIKAMIDGFISIGIEFDDYFYLPAAYYTPGTPVERRHYDMKNNQADPCHYGGGVHILPLMMCYEVLKDERILELCGKLTNFIIKYSGTFEDDGSFFVTGYFAGEDGHFHSRMSTVLGILYYALKTDGKNMQDIQDRKEMIEWCEKIYKYAKTQGTSYGFFPEGLGRKPEHNLPEEYPDVARHTEICCTADMIHIAALLSENGYDYYDDAEKFANQLFKSQLVDISDDNYFRSISQEDIEDTVNPVNSSYDNIAERYRGAFLGRVMANDLLNRGHYNNMGCCAAAGGRGIWTLWNYALTQKDNTAFLNLWFEVDNDVGSVKISEISEISENGGLFILTVALKTDNTGSTDSEIKIRVPECVMIKSMTVNKSSAEIIYEMKRKTTTEMLCGEPLIITWHGNTVADVSPKGIIPLYSDISDI
jgi:hypothetical protein